MYVEAFIPVAKHIEVQVIGDGKENYVHLGERDCSVQRKPKLIEEAPCAALSEERREKYVMMLSKLQKPLIIVVLVLLNF